jgi:phosphatidylserine/phosphatidylglycerophosphate/cardiolipin synthase-like enzyme
LRTTLKASPTTVVDVRRLLLLALCLTPTASGLTVDLAAPNAAPIESTPFAVDVAIEDAGEPVEIKAWLGSEDAQASRTWNGTSFQRSDFYARTVDPEAGSWQGRLWLQANPDSSNADALAADELTVGVRARTSTDTADALADVEPLRWNRSGWAAVGPERPLTVEDGNRTLVTLGAPERARPLAVPDPEPSLDVCGPEGCSPGLGWNLSRASETDVELTQRPSSDRGGVIVAGDRVCLLPPSPEEGPWRLAVDQLASTGACRPADPGSAVAELFHLGEALDRAPERPGRGEVVRDPVAGGWAPWRLPPGVDAQPVTARRVEGHVSVFGTREAGLVTLADVLAEAQHRVTASTYLLTSPAVGDLLAQTAQRGVDVHLYLEPDPVGGQPAATPRLIDRLERAGVHVHEAEGPTDGGLQHAKIVVVDSGLALVLTENMTEHGLPRDGEGNRGVGIGLANASLAAHLEAIFRSPGEGREIRPDGWRAIQAPVAVVTAPENAWRASGVPAWIEDAEGSLVGAVLRANPRWGPRSNAWLDAMVDHSRGASVEVTLSGVPEGAARSNREAIAYLEAHPDAGDLDARLSDPRQGTLHAKAIATPSAALVGSTNWGLGGVLLNREVNLLVHDGRVADEVREVLQGPEPGAGLGPVGPAREAVPAPGILGAALAAIVGLSCRWTRSGPGRGRRR